MADYHPVGVLSAVLLFSALTARDIYVGRSSLQRGEFASPGHHREPLPGTGSAKAQPSLDRGPVLQFQYCKVYQEYSRAINQLYPDIRIEGENYPPTSINRFMGSLFSYLKILSILLIISGQNPFILLGLDTPRAWNWTQENKIFSCLMAYFLCNMMETHFLSTGAFEIALNDVSLWSKLQSGYVPNIQEIIKILDNQMKISQLDQKSFSP